MKTENIEKALREGRYIHLKDDVLVSYRDQQLDDISRTKADVHLDLCLICKRRLLMFQGEPAAMDNTEYDAEDKAVAKQMLKGRAGQTEISETPIGMAAQMRFIEYVRQVGANWQAFAMQLTPVRGATRGGTEMWQWQSEDRRFRVYAILEPNADLTLHFSTSDQQLDGARLKVKAGSLILEVRLQGVSDSESRAEVTIKRNQRPKYLKGISIEIV